ncbi:hypothetical protein EWM64_g5940 [Hericium alpestre]|uniref:GST N-terminal domain-containing protein n=1 Tax=Hericium alpestre TaxID=135208 RepID=A0A4Y9ZX35_9AGAM|nr:hypothetical protein EWM64_g5940 [Hericium alpestre]
MPSTPSQKLILYDIPSTSEIGAWSPNTWKARLVLNIKELPYETIWVEYPDIKPTCLRIGAAPTATVQKPDGTSEAQYTLPVLQDPNTGAVISDSFDIAVYLEDTYPDTLALFPPGSRALLYLFSETWFEKVGMALWFPLAIAGADKMHASSREYYVRTKSAIVGKPMTEFRPQGDAGEKVWTDALAALSQVRQWIDKNGTGDKAKYVLGETFSYGDVFIVGWLAYYRSIVGVSSREWGDLMAADGGRWARLATDFDEHGWFKVD